MSTPTSSEMDSEACRRALDHYLSPEPEPLPELNRIKTIVAHSDLSADDAAEQVLWALRCASSNVAEAVRHLKGRQQEQVMTASHLINLAWVMYEHHLKKAARERLDNGDPRD